jgi:hypothetical protein
LGFPVAIYIVIWQLVGMETDRIHMKSDSDITFYHIFTRIRIRMFSNTNTNTNAKQISRIRYTFGYLLDLEDNIYQFSLLEIYKYKIK